MRTLLSVQKEDLTFSINGDFSIKNGDLEDTFKYKGLGFIEEVELRIKSSYGDWYFEAEKGANLYLFEGKMINQNTLEQLQEAIKSSLTQDDFLTNADFNVAVKVIDINEVAVKIVFSDNIKKYIDYRIQDVRIIFDLRNGTPRIVRN